MAIFMPQVNCYPKVGAGGDWAKWAGSTSTACTGRRYLFINCILRSGAVNGTSLITAFGRSASKQVVAGTETVCTSDPYILNAFDWNAIKGSQYWNNKIDAWQAHADGLWSSSTDIKLYGNSDVSRDIINISAYANTLFSSTIGTSTLLATGPTGAATSTPNPLCAGGATNLMATITLYDDGSITIA